MFKDSNQVVEAVKSSFHGCRVLVVGDLMLDRYLWGTVDRISPEAPVPIVRLDHRTHTAGGAANVAANLSSLGCRVSVAGLLGTDEEALQLLDLLQRSGVDTTSVLSAPDRPTTCKTRVVGGQQQMLRLDSERAADISPELRESFLTSIDEQMQGCSAVVLSDYGKGLLSASVCQDVIRRARALFIPVFTGPKGLRYEKYAGCDVLSPNRLELATVLSSDYNDLDALLHKGQVLRTSLGVRRLLVTLGELGIALLDGQGIHRFPALSREVFDVSGAGDTVLATVCVALTSGLDLHDAIRLANLAAGVVIRKVGTAPISRDELLAALLSDREVGRAEKVCSRASLLQRVAQWRVSGDRIVFTNGCFDLLHVGHLSLLEQARRAGDRLIVALNTDRSVRALKGADRPIVSETARTTLVAALPCVDAVVLFDEETPLQLIQSVRPEVLVKGGDYVEEDVVGAKEMKAWGGIVVLIPFVEGFSTTAILKRAKASMGEGSNPSIQ